MLFLNSVSFIDHPVRVNGLLSLNESRAAISFGKFSSSCGMLPPIAPFSGPLNS